MYLPDTYVVPQAIGVLFGVASSSADCVQSACVAAAAGRLDGLAVAGGMLLGIASFNAVFDWIRPLVKARRSERSRSQLAGVPRGALAITAAALAGFMLASRIERARA